MVLPSGHAACSMPLRPLDVARTNTGLRHFAFTGKGMTEPLLFCVCHVFGCRGEAGSYGWGRLASGGTFDLGEGKLTLVGQLRTYGGETR
jgi:hypothetical protein